MTIKRIHVNQFNIRKNAKSEEKLPVISVKTCKENRYGNNVQILHKGEVIATIIYRPHNPLSCGAKVWIETECDVVID